MARSEEERKRERDERKLGKAGKGRSEEERKGKKWGKREKRNEKKNDTYNA